MLDTEGMRHLYFDLQAVQSSMRLDDPDALVTAYARKMMAFLLFNRSPRHILMIGLGGGSLVKFCHRHLLETRLTVVEIDPDVIALRSGFTSLSTMSASASFVMTAPSLFNGPTGTPTFF